MVVHVLTRMSTSVTVAPESSAAAPVLARWRVGVGLGGGSVTILMGSLVKKRRKRMRKKKHKKMLRRTRHQRRK
jgi:NAD/NADP transhydrogenase alpha subunit